MSIEELFWGLSLDCKSVYDLVSLFFSICKSANATIHTSGCKISLWAVTADEKELCEKHSWNQDSDSLIRSLLQYIKHE